MYFYHLAQQVACIIGLFFGDVYILEIYSPSFRIRIDILEFFLHDRVSCIEQAMFIFPKHLTWSLLAVFQVWGMPCHQPFILFILSCFVDSFFSPLIQNLPLGYCRPSVCPSTINDVTAMTHPVLNRFRFGLVDAFKFEDEHCAHINEQCWHLIGRDRYRSNLTISQSILI